MRVEPTVLLPAAILAGYAVQAEPPARPNILLIVSDDENPDTIGCCGGAVQTPHIDSLARNGVRFTNANVVHTVCSPSRYAILTGRYYDNTFWDEFLRLYPYGTQSCIRNAMSLQDGRDTLVSVLRANGYYTAHIGKYHLADHHLLVTPKQWAQAGLQTYPHYFSRNQLFDLQNDPQEKANLFAQMPEKGAQMKQLLGRALQAHFPHRTFGELTDGSNPAEFKDVANAAG